MSRKQQLVVKSVCFPTRKPSPVTGVFNVRQIVCGTGVNGVPVIRSVVEGNKEERSSKLSQKLQVVPVHPSLSENLKKKNATLSHVTKTLVRTGVARKQTVIPAVVAVILDVRTTAVPISRSGVLNRSLLPSSLPRGQL